MEVLGLVLELLKAMDEVQVLQKRSGEGLVSSERISPSLYEAPNAPAGSVAGSVCSSTEKPEF